MLHRRLSLLLSLLLLILPACNLVSVGADNKYSQSQGRGRGRRLRWRYDHGAA